jgi:RNA polymerase sigma-70 factor (ECF subfamily)
VRVAERRRELTLSPIALAEPGYDARVQSDEELMAAYVSGEKAAFQEIFRRYAPLLQRTMTRDLRTTEEANDLVQQTFLHLHRSRLDFEPGRKLRPWIFTIALNLKREYFRRVKRRRESSLEGEGAPEPFEPPRGQERSDAAREVERALETLPAQQREVIVLHWLGGLSFPEVAESVGSTVAAVKVRAHRGYTALRGVLSQDTSFPEDGNPEASSGITKRMTE